MDPITLLFIAGGFKSMEELMTKLGLTHNTILQPMALINKVDMTAIHQIADFIKTYESFEPKAYYLKGEKTYTIGYGSTRWLTPTGGFLRNILPTDTITEKNAELLLYYYFYPIIPSVNLLISTRRLHPKLVGMLLQVLYGTGLGGVKYNFFKNCVSRCDGMTDVNKIADIFLSEVVATHKAMRNYNLYGLGWSRRLTAASDYIRGNLKKKIWYDQNIKKAY